MRKFVLFRDPEAPEQGSTISYKVQKRGIVMENASLFNTRGFTDDTLFDALSSANAGLGTPEMGQIAGQRAVIYRNVSDGFDVYASVYGSDIITGKSNNSPVSSFGSFGSPAVTSSEAEAAADNAVSQLTELIKQIEIGSPTASNSGSMSYFMEQKQLSMKPIYNVYGPDKAPVYHVEGDVPHLNYSIQKNGTEVMKLKKKLPAIMLSYSVILGGSEIGHLKQKVKLSRPEIVGTLNGSELKIAADALLYDFEVTLGGRKIGEVKKAALFDNYSIIIYDESCRDLLITAAVMCDHLVDRSGK